MAATEKSQEGHPLHQHVRASVSDTGSAPPGRATLKMKRTGKTGLLHPGLAASPAQSHRSVSSSTRPAGGSSAMAPLTWSPSPLGPFRPHPDSLKIEETSRDATSPASAGPLGQSPETARPMPNASSNLPATDSPAIVQRPPAEARTSETKHAKFPAPLAAAGVQKEKTGSQGEMPVLMPQGVAGGAADERLLPAASAIQYPKKTPVSTTPRGRRRPHQSLETDVDITPIHIAPSGRPYAQWYDDNGRPCPGHGALFPDGYKRDSSVRGNIWICPIRSCRQLRIYLRGLGKHFKLAHRDCLLKDERNGLFAIVGRYEGTQGPIVITRRPPKPGQKPMAQPRLTGNGMGEPILRRYDQPSHAPEQQFSGQHRLRHSVAKNEEEASSDVEMAEAEPPTSSAQLDDEVLMMQGGDDEVDVVNGEEAQPDKTVQSPGPGSDHPSGRRLFNAPSGRPYTSSASETTYGVPIPDGYERWAIKGHDWVCPIWSCRSVHQNRNGLAIHFGRKHRGQLLDDNLDGTLSVIPDPDAVDTVSKGDGARSAADEMWEYIRPYLRNFRKRPDVGWVPQLIGLPRVRDIAWNQDWVERNGFHDTRPLDVSTLIIQITGEHAPSPCSRCEEGGRGPYRDCIVISPAADPRVRASVIGCANCVYHGQQSLCSLARSRRQRAQGRGHPQPAASAEIHTPSSEVSGSESVAQDNRPRRSERVLLQEVLASSEESSKNGTTRKPDSLSTPVQQGPSTTRQSLETDNLEMDDWEIAPGRLRASACNPITQARYAAEPPENIAFSKAYLSNQTVRVSADVAFRVEVVSSGTPARWLLDSGRMRICSVATGKIRVRIDGEDEFSIGPHGMFKVGSGKVCVVQNRLYGDAVLHISEFPEDSWPQG